MVTLIFFYPLQFAAMIDMSLIITLTAYTKANVPTSLFHKNDIK